MFFIVIIIQVRLNKDESFFIPPCILICMMPFTLPAPIIACFYLPLEQTVETDQVRDGKVCLLTYPLSST